MIAQLETHHARQRSFDLFISDHRLLVSVDTARCLLDRDEQAIIDLIDEGRIQFAWNIAAPGAAKKERRIHRDSLSCYKNGFREPDTDATHDRYLAKLFPHSRDHIRLSELYRLLNCSSRHALDLMRAGCFGADAAALITQLGQRVSPTVPRANVIAFLKTRRLP